MTFLAATTGSNIDVIVVGPVPVVVVNRVSHALIFGKFRLENEGE
jgi:hypothetical protein